MRWYCAARIALPWVHIGLFVGDFLQHSPTGNVSAVDDLVAKKPVHWNLFMPHRTHGDTTHTHTHGNATRTYGAPRSSKGWRALRTASDTIEVQVLMVFWVPG